jgi:putative transcriptional regulator
VRFYTLPKSDLVRGLRVSRQVGNGFESGKFDPSLDIAFRLSRLLDVPIQKIFTHIEHKSMKNVSQYLTELLDISRSAKPEQRIHPSKSTILIIAHAKDCAGKSELGAEQLLTALLADQNSIAAQLLRANGAILPTNMTAQDSESFLIPRFNTESEFVLEIAEQVVRLKGQELIAPEHLLWGLIRLSEVGNSTAKEMFQRFGINLTTLNQQLIEAI